MKITGSIVLYEENLKDLHTAIECFLNIPIQNKLYLIDNTPTKFFEYVFVNENIKYIPVEENIGFGSAHNKVIDKIEKYSDYHLILNPDISFKPKIITTLIKMIVSS